ncbi:MAG: Mbeg1-like protein, partial [Ruminiclostridium sp.]
GTGDGNWVYNSAAYGTGEASEMQKQCLEWFDSVISRYGDESKNIYVTGHSQGANNAMYVTMCSEYADRIDACVPLNGPGFSQEFVDERKETLGNEYNERTDKIWAYNTDHDFVSTLGEATIVPDGHVAFVKYSRETHEIENYHCSIGMVDKNGQFVGITYDDSGESDFRKRVRLLVGEIKDLPQEQRESVAVTVMKICENYIGDQNLEPRTENITKEEFDEVKEALGPALITLLAYDPDGLVPIIQDLTGMDNESAESIVNIIQVINRLPENERIYLIESAADLFTIEDNKIVLDMTKLHDTYSAIKCLFVKDYILDPENFRKTLEELGVKDAPLQFAIQVGVILLFGPIDRTLERITFAIDVIETVLAELGIDDEINKFISDLFNAIVNAIGAVQKWYNETFNKGYKFSQSNPWFRADTDKLRGYANRLSSVNRRLRALDGAMRGLYWQVGLLDLWDILCANILISESRSLDKARKYLNNTADRLEKADNKANNYMGG